MADKQVAHADPGFQWTVETTPHNVSLVLNQPVDLGPRVKTHSVSVVNKLREVPIFTKVKEIDSENKSWPWEIIRMSVTFTIKRIPPPNPEKMHAAAAAIDVINHSPETPKVLDALHHLADLAKTGPDGLHKTVVPLLKVITRPRVPMEVKRGAEDVLRNVVDDFLPIDEFLGIIDGDDKPEVEAAKKVLEEQLECLDHLGSPEARLLHLYDNMNKDLPDSVPKTKQAVADAIQALEKDLTKEVENIEVLSIPEHPWKPRSPRKRDVKRPTSPKRKPEELAKELAAKAVEDAQEALAAADAALENLKLADANTKDPEKKKKLKPKLMKAAKNRTNAASALQNAQDVEDDLLEALEGEVLDPAVLDDKLDKARKAAKEAEEAGQAGKAGEAEAIEALEEGVADIAEEDLRPKALAAAEHAHHDAKKADKHAKDAKKLCDKIKELLPKLPEEVLPQDKKDEIAKKRDREDSHADSALAGGKKADKVAKQVPKDCEEHAKVKPAYLAAIDAQQKAKKAKDKGEHAHKKAKKLLKGLKDKIPIAEIDPTDLAQDAKQLAEDAKDRAKAVEAKAKKAKQIADHAPPHQKHQADDVKEKAQKAEDAAKDAEKAAEAALDKIKELEAAVARLPEHPEEAAKVAELAKEARDLADKADKLSDLAEKLAQDLDFAMHSAVAPPEHADADLPVEVDAPLSFFLPPYAETPLEDIHLDLAKIPNPFLPELFDALKKQDEKEKELDAAAKDLADKADKLEDAKKKERDAKKHALEAKEDAIRDPTPANLQKAKKAADDAAKAADDTHKAKEAAEKAKEKAIDLHKDVEKARAHVPEVGHKAEEFDAKEKDRVAPINPELKKNLDALKPQVVDDEKKAEKDFLDALDKLKKAEAFEPEHPKPTPDDVLSADKDVRDLEKALEDALKDAEDAKKKLKDAEEAAKKAHEKADKLAEEAKKHPTPENIAAAQAAEDEADDYDESKLLAKIKAGEAQGTADDILDALEKARAKACEERLKKKNDLYPDAEEPSAEDQKEYDAFKGDTEKKEGKADIFHDKAMDDLAKAAAYEPLVPSKADVARKIAEEAAKIADEADKIAQDAIDAAKDAEALSFDQKPEGLEPALDDALKAKGLAHHALKDADDVDDKLDELVGEPLTPAQEEKLLEDAKKALDEAKKAHDAAKAALDKCKDLKPVPSMMAEPNDIIPKIKEAVKKAREHADHAKKLEPRTKDHAEKAKKIAKPIPVPADLKPLKEDILHNADESKKDADHAGDDAKDVEKLAEEALEPVKVAEGNPNVDVEILLPALDKALKALHKGKKAHHKGKKAHHKGKKAHHKAKHLKPEHPEFAGEHAGDHPEHAHPGDKHPEHGHPGDKHPEHAHPVDKHPEHAHPEHGHPGDKHPEHAEKPIDPEELIAEAKKLADDLKDKAGKNKPHAKKARHLPLPFSPQVNDDFHGLVDDAEKLGNDAEQLADDLKHLVAEIQPILDEAKAHPENPELQDKAHHLLDDLAKLADKADKLNDKAEDALEDLLDGLDNFGPMFPDDEIVKAPEINVEAGRHRPDHAAGDEPFPCPFCQNTKWNWPEIFTLGLEISEEDQQKLSAEEKCNKKMEAIQKAINKLNEVAKLVEAEKQKLSTP